MEQSRDPPLLGLLAMARNECPAYAEWLGHHRQQGVGAFYLIDNNSSVPCLGWLQQQPDVTVFSWSHRAKDTPSPRSHRSNSSNHKAADNGSTGQVASMSNQQAAYNHFLPEVRTTWLGIWDLDEFVFGVSTTLAEQLRAQPPWVLQMCLPWLTFGSRGLIEQPSCVTASNILRRESPDRTVKCVQRTLNISRAEVHRSVLSHETYARRARGCICADGASCKCCGNTGPYPAHACGDVGPARYFSRHRVRLHHYVSQSQQRMEQRSKAGDADQPRQKRDWHYWQRIEILSNSVRDASLARHSPCRARLDAESDVDAKQGLAPTEEEREEVRQAVRQIGLRGNRSAGGRHFG
jgi:hypothetical protein